MFLFSDSAMQRTYFTDFIYDCFNKTVDMTAIHTLKIIDLLKFLSMTAIPAAVHIVIGLILFPVIQFNFLFVQETCKSIVNKYV